MKKKSKGFRNKIIENVERFEAAMMSSEEGNGNKSKGGRALYLFFCFSVLLQGVVSFSNGPRWFLVESI